MEEEINKKKHKFCPNFFIEIRTVNGLMFENILQAEGQQMTR